MNKEQKAAQKKRHNKYLKIWTGICLFIGIVYLQSSFSQPDIYLNQTGKAVNVRQAADIKSVITCKMYPGEELTVEDEKKQWLFGETNNVQTMDVCRGYVYKTLLTRKPKQSGLSKALND